MLELSQANSRLPPPSLEVSGLSLLGDMKSLGPLSFTLPRAGCWWLAGASGAGKSLLMESLAGFHAEARGSIRINGQEISHCAPERRSIALMPQRWRLFPLWTVSRNLRFAAQLGGAHRDRIEYLAEYLRVAELLDRPIRALSGGETQRICLMQTLLSSARVLLLDEPLSAIDAALQSVALELLSEEAATRQRICLVATHHPKPSFPLHGALLIDDGRLLGNTKSD